MIDDIINEYQNIDDFIQQKLIEKYVRKEHVIYQSQHMPVVAGLRMSYVLLREA